MSRRLEPWLLVLILLGAAAIRIAELSSLPAGFSDDEIVNLSLADTVRLGAVSSLYSVGGPAPGREGLYPLLQAVITGIAGHGLLITRLLSLFGGLLSVALAYRLGRRLFGHTAGIVTALSMAVTFWPVLLSRSALPVAILLPLFTGMILALSRALHLRQRIDPDPPNTVAYAIVGMLIGTMAYAHWTALVTLPLLIVYAIYLIVTRQALSRRVPGYILFTILIVLVVSIPYLTFSLRAPNLSGFMRFWAERPESVGEYLSSILRTLASLAFRGDPRPDHNLSGWPLLNPLLAVLFLIGLIEAIRRWRAPNMMLMLLLLFFGLGTDAWSRGDVNFAHQIIALPAILTLVGLGATLVIERAYAGWGRARRWLLSTVVVGGMALLAGLMLWVTLDSLFERWAALPAVHETYNGRLGRLASYLDRHPDGQTTSICTFRLDPQPIGERGLTSASFSDRYLLEWMLHRPADGLRYSNCVSGLVLTRGGEPQRFAFADPAGPWALAAPFQRWLADAQPVSVPGLPNGLMLSVDAHQAVADTFGQTIQSEVAYAPETIGPSDFAVLPIRMGGYLTFEGYDFEPSGPFRPGDSFTVVTYWRADGEQVRGLGLFVHVMRNPYTAPVLQNDISSIDETLLENRDVFIQLVPISIPTDFPPGEYLVSLGGYSTVSGARLPIFDEDQERGSRLFLRPIRVE